MSLSSHVPWSRVPADSDTGVAGGKTIGRSEGAPSSLLHTSARSLILPASSPFQHTSSLQQFLLSSPCLSSPFASPIGGGAAATATVLPPGGGRRAGTVETVSGWRKQAKAERDAGLAPESGEVILSYYDCQLCEIGIGPNNHEQELFFYPVYREEVCLGDTPMFFEEVTLLLICGGCARSKRRMLPMSHCLVRPEHWTTNCLLLQQQQQDDSSRSSRSEEEDEEEEETTPLRPLDTRNELEVQQMLRAVRRQVIAMCHYHLMAWLVAHHIPVSLIFETRKKPKPALPAFAQKSPLLSFFSHRTTHLEQLTPSPSSLPPVPSTSPTTPITRVLSAEEEEERTDIIIREEATPPCQKIPE